MDSRRFVVFKLIPSSRKTPRRDQALDAMPETLRVPLLLRDLDGLSYQEIAEGLNLSLSAVKMRIKRGREDFRRRYSGGLPSREHVGKLDAPVAT